MKILISEKIDAICPKLFQEAGFEVDYRQGLSPAELVEIIGDYDGLVVRSAVKVTAEALAKGAPRLKVVGRAGAGVDTIDVDAATKAGVLVMNTPGQNANGVAELVLGLMLSLVRHIAVGCAALKAGRWEKSRLAGTELRGKTIGLVGFGAVGRRAGALAQAFGMTVLAYDPFLNDEQITAGGAQPRRLDDILRESDFVSLHLPKTKETANLIDRAALDKMKPTAALINCARGGLVDEAELAAALREGRLAGAALDVFAEEPPAAGHPLLALDNFVGTPHLGASTAESQVNVAEAVARQMIDFFQNGGLVGAVNSITKR
ncbi:MAG: hydroxyacid dehydrogenase [Candidatus Adiutrix sp.]|jgi:D-3-phosphoglycerate dehydrogenase|nr:hydroxyacid dehydrogenase [Candidatus Adiutrix sp.]